MSTGQMPGSAAVGDYPTTARPRGFCREPPPTTGHAVVHAVPTLTSKAGVGAERGPSIGAASTPA